jgi:DHA1 family multidrug resistance protein-like MFS transporter
MGRGAVVSSWYGQNRVLVWVCALTVVNQLGFGSIVPVVPLYAKSFGVPQSAIGLAIGIYGLARFVLNMPAGNLCDIIGRRGVLAIGGLIVALGNLLCAIAPSYLPFLGARFVAGAGAALILTASQVALADISTPERRGRILAIYSGVFSFAVGIGPFPGGLLAGHFGLPAPFFTFTVLGLVASAFGYFRVPETKGMRGGQRVAPSAAPPLPFRVQARKMFAEVGFVLVALVSFGAFFARTGALFNIIPVMGEERLNLSPDQIGLGLGMISIVGLGLAYPSGWLVDRFGRKVVIVPSTIITGVSMIVFSIAPTYGWFLAGCFFWSCASGISGSAPAAYAADMAPPGMNAAAMSTYRMLADFGYVAGPLLLGLLADGFGTNTALYTTAIGLVIFGLLFARYAPETYRRGKRLLPPQPAPVTERQA